MFALGVWMCQRLPSLPAAAGLVAASCVLTAAGALAFLRRRDRGHGRQLAIALAAVAAGLLWAAWRAEWRLADELPMAWEGRDVAVTGVVAELPQALERGTRFVLQVEEADAPVPRRVVLSWYDARGDAGRAPALRPGERWRLTVRLKRPHGLANPHGFDYEAWLLERDLRATGYVRTDADNRRLAALVPRPMLLVHRLRAAIRTRFAADLPNGRYAGILIALAVGDQRAIPREQWQVFRHTGVAHLVSISGLHVSLVALIAGMAAGWAWRRAPALVLRFPARKAAALAAFACAAAYALLAGLGIPAQRALIMLGVVVVALLRGHEALGSRVMALALLGVLAVDPWAVLAPGFWLSFAAVGIILFVLGGRLAPAAGWRAAAVMQLAITVATIPGLLVLFNAFSLIAPLANALAIPLVSFVLTPLTLLAIVVPLAPLLELAHWLSGLMMRWLEWLAIQPLAMWQQAVPPPALAVAGMAGIAWALLPRGTPARAAGVLAALPMLLWTPPRPAPGEFDATVLDVGHGLAVHVQTATHDLVYDTGPAYGPDSDAGERVLVPYLVAAGVRRLDRLVISHDDIDHSGGAASLLEAFAVTDTVSGLAPGHPLRGPRAGVAVPCVAGTRWQWDGVDFELLHPGADDPPYRRDNDTSCVLRIAAPGGSLLLAGDIESGAERRLVARYGAALASSVVVVPHHGSRSSSTPALVDAADAETAIFTVGYRNAFGHPHPAVWERWVAAGARNWRTDSQGAVHIAVRAAGSGVAAERTRRARYWHGR